MFFFFPILLWDNGSTEFSKVNTRQTSAAANSSRFKERRERFTLKKIDFLLLSYIVLSLRIALVSESLIICVQMFSFSLLLFLVSSTRLAVCKTW